MKIEHVGLYVHDLEGARAFFENYFAAKSNDRYHNPKTGFQSYFLTFEDGARLEIMTKETVQSCASSAEQLGYAHLAFSLGSKEAVDSLTQTLEQAGYKLLSGPRVTGDGYYESLFEGFEGNLLELTV